MSSRSGTDPTDRPGPFRAVGIVVVAVLLGLVAGAAGGMIAYDYVGPGSTADVTLQTILQPSLSDGASVYVYGGAAAGVLLGLAAAGLTVLRAFVGSVAGAYAGSLAALLIYFIGYVAATEPGALFSSAFFETAAQGLREPTAWLWVTVGTGVFLGAIVQQYAWSFRGLLAFVSIGTVIVGYIGYMLFITLPQVPESSLPLSITLFVAEGAMLIFALIYAFHPIDTSDRKRWERTPEDAVFDEDHVPHVAFHVPTFNEPPDMVIETIEHLMAVEYPHDRFTIMVLDDSTEEHYRAPVRRFCEENDLTYIHRDDRTGYKAGALNVALELTPDEVELVAVIDADYQVQPEYLRETVGYFADEELAFLQTPQNYRNRDASFLTEQYYYADGYFYQTVLPSRNEANAIIFCGTMGIVREDVLEEIGGWDEEVVTEDAELAARILGADYRSLYINRPYGAGLIPESFEAYKKQHHRWAFGGGQVLRKHLGTFLFRMTPRQRFDFIAGSINWFDGLFLTIIALVLMALGLGDLAGWDLVTHHQSEVWLVGLIPIFLIVEALVRLQLAMNHHFDLGFRDTLKVAGMWFSVKFSNAKAALKGFVGFSMPFVRTPKGADQAVGRSDALRKSVALTPFETLMACALFAIATGFTVATLQALQAGADVHITKLFLSGWLYLYTLVYASAPLYAYRSFEAGSGGGGHGEGQPQAA